MYSDRGRQMFEYLSWYYRDSRIMQAVLDSQGQEIDSARQALEDTLKQFFATLAGEWGIEFWEKELAINPPPNSSLDLRRALVKAKLLATEIMTPERIEAICNCFVPTQAAQVVEVPKTYTFKVQTPFDDFVWIDEMRSALNSAKPAHLAAIVEYCARFSDDAPNIASVSFARCFLPLLSDGITWRGRHMDGGWHYIAPAVYDSAWSLDGRRIFDGAVDGPEDEIKPGATFNSTWQLDGSISLALHHPTRKIRMGSMEAPDELYVEARTGQADRHAVTLLLNDSRRPLDGAYLLGQALAAQETSPELRPELVQSESVTVDESGTMHNECLLRENYPLPRMQYFNGAWGYGAGNPLDGRWLLNVGHKLDGLQSLPDPTVFPGLLDGCRQLSGFSLSAQYPAVAHGSALESADDIEFATIFSSTETLDTTETMDIAVDCIAQDFAYAPMRLDGSFDFKAVAVFDGFWIYKGDCLHDGTAASRAETLPAPQPLSGLFDGSKLFNAGANHQYDGTAIFDTLPIETAQRWTDSRLQALEAISPSMVMQDEITQSERLDGDLALNGEWDLSSHPGGRAAVYTEIKIGRRFNGKWLLDAGNKVVLAGTWNLDGSKMYTLLGDCKSHFDGDLEFDGKTVFWKGGETFEHYRYATSQ